MADETFLVKLNRIIQENLSDTKLDVSFICKEVGMSRASLYTKLKALTGIGLNEYINKIRHGKGDSSDYCYRFYIYGYFRESRIYYYQLFQYSI